MHPKWEEWVEYASGEMAGDLRARLDEHLAGGCAPCLARARELGRLFETIASDRLLEPSGAALEAALGAFRPAHSAAPRPRWARSLVELTARLVLDTARGPGVAFAGARNAGLARRLRFEAAELELDVLVEAQGDIRHVTAQLLTLGPDPSPLSGARFLLVAGGRLEAEGETDAHGELVRDVAGAGEIEIRVAWGRRLAVFRIPARIDPSPAGPFLE
jgi:hypothetical protein